MTLLLRQSLSVGGSMGADSELGPSSLETRREVLEELVKSKLGFPYPGRGRDQVE